MLDLHNVVLPSSAGSGPAVPFQISFDQDQDKTIITKVTHHHPSDSSGSHAGHEPPSLLLPSLIHPHVHLDKPYILTCNRPGTPSKQHPDYSDLVPKTGAFDEALANTSKAKERYTEADLYLRGSQLLATSYSHGVSALRAFVEVDHVTGTAPLATAVKLKHDFAHLLHVQICVFAQDPIFSTKHGEENRVVITSALRSHGNFVEALGTTPYVEESSDTALHNIEWAVKTALEHGLHLDFHLDYNLQQPCSADNRPLVFSVVDVLERHNWTTIAKPSMTIVLGHCTQLTVLDSELNSLAKRILDSGLPIYFVGLPTSDLFMMGRPGTQGTTHARPRGTLQVPAMIKQLGLSACLGINNVGNAFTPYGNADPLQLASWGVGIYQAGTLEDAELLYGCVSWRARQAIGLARGPDENFKLVEGRQWEKMLLIKNPLYHKFPGARSQAEIEVLARPRLEFKDVVWDPPDTQYRMLI